MIFIYTGSIKSIVQHDIKNEVTENYILMFNDKKHFGKHNFKVVGAISYSFDIAILKLNSLILMYLLKEYELRFTTQVFLFSHFCIYLHFIVLFLYNVFYGNGAKYEMYAYNVFFCCRKNMFFVLANES